MVLGNRNIALVSNSEVEKSPISVRRLPLALIAGVLMALAVAVAALFHSSKGLPVRLAGPPRDAADCRPVVIEVSQDGWIRLRNDNLRIRDLPRRLAEMFRTRADRAVFVKGDPNLTFQDVVTVIDAAIGQGYTVALLTPAVDRCCCPTILGPFTWMHQIQ